MDNGEIGVAIKNALKERGIKQADLVRKYDMSTCFISRLCRGDFSPAIKTFIGVVAQLDIAKDVSDYSKDGEIYPVKIAKLEAENAFLKAKIEYLETLQNLES